MAKAKSSDQLALNVSSSEIYDVSEPCRGYAVIIANFRFFDKQLDIEDAEDDTLTLMKTFAQMQFKVENHNNVTAQEIVDLMRSYRKKDQSNYGCFVCVLLSRGLGDSICGSDGVFVSVPELLNSFADCVSLEGKPKFVFIDACRFVFEPFRVYLPKRCRDFLICSIRAENLENTLDRPDRKFSTFFYALCHVFRDWGEKAEIDELLVEIKQAVQKHSNQLQTIEIKQNLTKKCVFTPGWRICKHCTSCINTKICTKCMSNERRLAVAELTLEENIVKSMQNSRSTNFSMKSSDQFQTKYSDNEIARPCSAAKEELKRVENATVVRRITSENYLSAQEIITDPGVSNLNWDTVKLPAELRTSQEHHLSSAVRKGEHPYTISNTESVTTTNTLCDTHASNEIRIVLVGRTGAGKSATGNLVMGKKFFESKLSGNLVTQKCKRGECTISGRHVVIVDTPGIFDTRISSEILSAEIIRCIHMSIPGPHVFLLVVQIARFTAEEIESFNRLFDLFGEHGKFCMFRIYAVRRS